MRTLIRRIYLVLFILCISVVSVLAQQCQAITKKSTQCSRKAQAGSSYCWQHRPTNENQSKSTSEPSIKGTSQTGKKEIIQKQTTQQNKETYSGQCQSITKNGKQCSRKAKAGSRYCLQHGG